MEKAQELLVFCFFQAEDCIRDFHVTGVQTCALPIFARMSATVDSDPAHALHRRAFVRDARRHVDDIADKYICPDEGTYDFALCYLPSEAVFYEFLREDPPGESCWRYAVE